MKMFPLPAVGHASVARTFLFLMLLLVGAVRAEWITLQVPIARAQHTFSLWQFVSTDLNSGDASLENVEGFQLLTGGYLVRTAMPFGITGGSFNAEGQWVPGPGSYVTVLGDRQNQGLYFLRDDTTSELSPPDQLGLVDAVWRYPGLGGNYHFFSIASARSGNLLCLAVDQGSSGTSFQPLTVGGEQRRYDTNGGYVNYGFFEAYGALDPGLPFTVLDLTTNEQAPWGEHHLVNASWQTISLLLPTSQLTLFVGTAGYYDSFTLTIEGGSAQTLSADWVTAPSSGSDMGVQSYAGIGKRFWLTRIADNMTSPTFFTDIGATTTLDLTSHFPAIPPTGTVDLHFRISPALNPWAMTVWSDLEGVYKNLQVNSWPNSQWMSAPDGQWVEMTYYDCWARVVTDGSWHMADSSSNQLGQGPDFFDWPPPPPPTTNYTIYLPSYWRQRSLATSDGNPLTLSQADAFGDYIYNPFTSEAIWQSIDEYSMTVNAGTSSVSLMEQGNIETSSVCDLGANSPNSYWQGWHPTTELTLRISATRWGNSLYVRSANGDQFSVNAHAIQGNWAIDSSTGIPAFTSYGWFDANSTFHSDLDWQLWDDTRQEVLSSGSDPTDFIGATDHTDTDGDGLEDWYERLIGTSPTVVDSDGDGVSDGQEVSNGTNPRARAASLASSTLRVFTPLE